MPRIVKVELELTDAEWAQTLHNLSAKPNSAIISVDGQPVAALLASTAAPGESDDEGPVNSNAPVTDKNGIPHLVDVHAGSKAMNEDGTWRRKRGVAAETQAAAEKAWLDANVSTPQTQVAAAPVGLPGVPDATPPAAAPAAAPVGLPGVPGATAPAAAPVGLPGIPGSAAPAATPGATLGIPGMTAPQPDPLPPVTEPPVSLDDVLTSFQALQTKYPSVNDEYVKQLYAAAGTTGAQLETDESARRRLIGEINKVLAM